MTNYQKELITIDQTLAIPEIHEQVREILTILTCLDKRRVLTEQPKPVGLLPDKYDELYWQLKGSKRYLLKKIDNLFNNFRSYLSRKYGLWSLANLKTAQTFKDQYQIKTSLEVMAGNGYWSKALSEVGVKAISTDSMSWAKSSQTGMQSFYQTEKLGALEAIKKYQDVDLVLCCWAPNFGQADLEVLQAFRKYTKAGSHLLFIGEKDGATNTDEFWKHAKIINDLQIKRVNQTFPNFDFIDEKVYEIK